MDGLSAEVSAKIRAAISAKLKELGAYVDDELPDYIMVLVANKKTQEQMKEDLQLFLNNHAEVFTAWLQDILNKLKQVTKAPKSAAKEKKEKTAKKKKEPKEKKKKKKSESGSSPIRQRSRSRSVSKEPTQSRSDKRIEKSPENRYHRSRSPQKRRTYSPVLDKRHSPRNDSHRSYSPKKREVSRSYSPNRRREASRSYSPSRRRDIDHRQRSVKQDRQLPSSSRDKSRPYSPLGQLKSAIGSVAISREEPYDPEQMLKRSLMASKIQVPPRKHQNQPTKGNEKLLIKAVQDADRSIAKKRSETRQKENELDEIHRQRMRATLKMKQATTGYSSEDSKSSISRKKSPPAKKIIIVKKGSSEDSDHHDSDLRLRLEEKRQNSRKVTLKKKMPVEEKAAVTEDDAELEKIRQRALNSMIINQQQKRSRNSSAENESKIIIPLNEASSSSEEENDDETSLSSVEERKDPKFIVTLDGINSSYFKQKDSNAAGLSTTSTGQLSLNNKPAAMIAPMKHEKKIEEVKKVVVAPEKKSTPEKKLAPAKTKMLEKKEAPEKKVVRKRISAPEPDPVTAKPAEELAKKPRKRITAPEPEASPIPVVTTQEVCKFWPKCKRGSSCLYLHPKSPKIVPTIFPPKEKLKWTK